MSCKLRGGGTEQGITNQWMTTACRNLVGEQETRGPSDWKQNPSKSHHQHHSALQSECNKSLLKAYRSHEIAHRLVKVAYPKEEVHEHIHRRLEAWMCTPVDGRNVWKELDLHSSGFWASSLENS